MAWLRRRKAPVNRAVAPPAPEREPETRREPEPEVTIEIDVGVAVAVVPTPVDAPAEPIGLPHQDEEPAPTPARRWHPAGSDTLARAARIRSAPDHAPRAGRGTGRWHQV